MQARKNPAAQLRAAGFGVRGSTKSRLQVRAVSVYRFVVVVCVRVSGASTWTLLLGLGWKVTITIRLLYGPYTIDATPVNSL